MKFRSYVSLYFLMASVYLVTCSGRIGLSDSVAMFNVAESIISNGTFSSEPCDPTLVGQPNHCVLGKDGRHYSGFGLLPSVLAVPSILAARFSAAFLHVNPQLAMRLTASLFTALITPLIGVVLSMWIIELGYSRFTAICGALIIAFSSSIWHFGVTGFYSALYFTLALLLSGFFLSLPKLRYAA